MAPAELSGCHGTSIEWVPLHRRPSLRLDREPCPDFRSSRATRIAFRGAMARPDQHPNWPRQQGPPVAALRTGLITAFRRGPVNREPVAWGSGCDSIRASMSRTIVSLLLPTIVLGGVGCTSNESRVRAKAASDLSCSELQVSPSGGDTYRVKGCGKEATYNCYEGTLSGVVCERLVETRRGK